MNILLIYPKFPETFWSFTYALRFIKKRSAFPPLGLLTVAAMLPGEWPKRLVDENTEALTEEDLAWADLALIGAMALQRKGVDRIIARCKSKGLKVVAGGPLFTAEPEAFPQVDHLVLGEAELSLPEFIADLNDGCPKRFYQADGYPDIGETPVPLWDLISMRRYASMNIQYSRGCPFDCDFCNITALFGRTPRIKAPQQIIAELDAMYAAGWRGNVFFVDDNFIGNKRSLKTHLLPALIEWRKDKKGCVFFTEASINLADDPELMEMMAKAGFDAVFIGIETPDEDSLAECCKIQNKNRDLIQDVKKIHRSGLQVMGGFIVGFDSDTPSIFQRQIDFIQNSSIVTAMVGLLQAPPGTRLFDRLAGERRICAEFSGDNVDGRTNIIPTMGLARLTEGYLAIMKHIYSPRGYYRRIKGILRELKSPSATVPPDWQRLLAFWRACLRLGVLGKERYQYWRLMMWTLVRRPRMLPLAVTLAIYGYHYRRICELHILGAQ
ncbi:B12-binding domain-containing radical SAM protein [Desulfatitalea tepidiphila]|uniref:B12-binding domain-containing radical SAM protein n=1 Tax=Desulfatitalea tepidiphila TaxID=1185843 RepID=UPI0006B55B0A|nr:B12-binding domain-containing radical SAM protein [Desulfatitalea tepidiphila]